MAATDYCVELELELDANAWLQSELLARLPAIPKDPEVLKIHTQTTKIINGRTLRSGLVHLYLLVHTPFVDDELDRTIVERFCEETGSDLLSALHYYRTYRGHTLPRPFVRAVLRNLTSNGSADSIIAAIVHLQFANLVSSDSRLRNAMAIEFKPMMFELTERWIDMKRGGSRYGRR